MELDCKIGTLVKSYVSYKVSSQNDMDQFTYCLKILGQIFRFFNMILESKFGEPTFIIDLSSVTLCFFLNSVHVHETVLGFLPSNHYWLISLLSLICLSTLCPILLNLIFLYFRKTNKGKKKSTCKNLVISWGDCQRNTLSVHRLCVVFPKKFEMF